MSVVRFVNGFASKESDKVTYFIPRYGSKIVPADLTILEVADLRETKETGRKYYEAYKANITSENLKAWNSDLLNTPGADCLKDALNGDEQYEVKLKSRQDKQATIDFSRNLNKKKVSLGAINLEKIEIIPSVGRLLETVILNLEETAEENRRIKDWSAKVQKKQVELEENLEGLVKAKFQMEDKMTRAFTRCLNTKKERILQLEKQIENLAKTEVEPVNETKMKVKAGSSRSHLRMSTIMGVSSPESEGEKLSDQEITTDYDDETDVQDSDDEKGTRKRTKIAKKGRIQVLEKPPGESENPTLGCRKNLFAVSKEPVTPTPSRPRRTNANYSLSNDSQTDSSQEFFIPVLKTQKVQHIKRTELIVSERGKNGSTSRIETAKEIEKNEPPEACDDPEETIMDEPKTKRSRSDEESRSVHSSPDNDDILEQIFAFDSQ